MRPALRPHRSWGALCLVLCLGVALTSSSRNAITSVCCS